ncbi:MAG: TSUP family transporter [Pseudomonadota bacterium]
MNFPVHVATATSHFILAIMALTGTVVHILLGGFNHGVHRTIALAIGVVIGAQIGARLSEKIQGGWIIRSLAIALGLVGLRIAIMSW